eukprot:2840524-Rhodomonas_salina.1
MYKLQELWIADTRVRKLDPGAPSFPLFLAPPAPPTAAAPARPQHARWERSRLCAGSVSVTRLRGEQSGH